MENFNTYLANIDTGFWRNICAENGMLRRYKKGDCFCRAGEAKIKNPGADILPLATASDSHIL